MFRFVRVLICFGNIDMLRIRRVFVGIVCVLAVVLLLSVLNGQRSSKVLVSSVNGGRNLNKMDISHYLIEQSVHDQNHRSLQQQQFNENIDSAGISSASKENWPSEVTIPSTLGPDDNNTNADSSVDLLQHTTEAVVQPVADVVRPAADVVNPVADVVQPVTDVAHQPGPGVVLPVPDDVKPVADAVKPVADAVKPVADVVHHATIATVEECKPRKNIVFFKMHKCSSSTVQNILFRYGENHNLNFVVPVAGNYLGHATFSKQAMVQLPTKEYNILCHHTRFNEPVMKEVMPPDTVYVSILREPVSMYESMFTYSKYGAIYNIHSTNNLKTFLEKPAQYYNSHGGKDHGKNPMLYDFGLENSMKDNQQYIDTMIQKLDKRFDLVMMTEYFHESLILFKELMCWSFDDLLYFTLNARSKSSVVTVDASMQTKIQMWNEGDVKLYNHFNKTFWIKVREFGEERMKNEIKQLIEHNDAIYKHCVATVSDHDQKVWHPPGIVVESFQIKESAKNDKQCIAMARTELPYTDVLRRLMKSKFHIK